MDLHNGNMEFHNQLWKSVIMGFVAFGIPSVPYFVVKLFICSRNSNKCTHIYPDMWSLIWGIIPRYNQIIRYISDWYMALWKPQNKSVYDHHVEGQYTKSDHLILMRHW